MGGALPLAPPAGTCCLGRLEPSEIKTSFQTGPGSIQEDAQPAGKKTSGFTTRHAISGSSESWDRPISPRKSPLRMRPCSGARAFHPNNARSVMTHGIMTLRSGWGPWVFMEAMTNSSPPFPKTPRRGGPCQMTISNGLPSRSDSFPIRHHFPSLRPRLPRRRCPVVRRKKGRPGPWPRHFPVRRGSLGLPSRGGGSPHWDIWPGQK